MQDKLEYNFSGDNPVHSAAATSINIHYDITPWNERTIN